MKNAKQQSFDFRCHGGFRENSGCKKIRKDEPSHQARECIDAKTPLHISFKLVEGAPGLRTPKFMKRLGSLLKGARKSGLHIQHYAIESNHIHLIAEADDNESLRRGMLSVTSSITWALRKIFMFHGKVFKSRYHLHTLKTPSEMRNAIRYVLFNHSHHRKVAATIDFYSSAICFDDIGAFINYRDNGYRPPWHISILEQLTQARSWMQREGWRRARQ